jgi:hypothetical protein
LLLKRDNNLFLNKSMEKPRQLKVTELTQSGRNGEVPQLRINGKWLAALGFKIGETVKITTREKLLVIEPIQEETKL